MYARVLKTTLLAALLAGPALALAAPGQPNFMPALWGDGELWGTKGTTVLPAPTPANVQSFDVLYVIVNGPDQQLPVSEAAPGNPDYNGGRWFTHTVLWTAEGMAAHDPLPILTSYDDIVLHHNLGHLEIAPGSFAGGPPDYFQCPLLPIMGN